MKVKPLEEKDSFWLLEMNSKVIYTTIFGDYDTLVDPHFIDKGWDYICFTDNENLSSDVWEIRKCTPYYTDLTRSAKRYKILPHRFLKEYGYSIFVDGNMTVRGYVDQLLNGYNVSFFDHAQNKLDPRNCIYKEADTILQLGIKNNGNYKDSPVLIQNQISRYKKEGYPKNNGLITGMIILRKHNEKDCIEAMEEWWNEIKYNSKRDQLSFNYVAWKTDLKFSYLDGDSRNNKWFLSLGKHTGKGKKIKVEYEPINLDYFLQMELQSGGGKEVILNDYKLKTVGDVVNYWKKEENRQKVKLDSTNWQYYNTMIAGFKYDIDDHHEIGWENLTEEYFKKKKDMTDLDIEKFLRNSPVEFDNGFIRHGYHRACAMIGRLIRGEKYFPFYMLKDNIYNKPRKKDGIHRIYSPVSKLKNILELDSMGFPREDYTLTQSAILTLMGIRQNDDVDVIVSIALRDQLLGGETEHIKKGNVEIFSLNRLKFAYFDAQGDDDLINNYSKIIDGYNFLQPRFYFARKNKSSERDKTDWEGIYNFKVKELYKGYPFNVFTKEEWGFNE